MTKEKLKERKNARMSSEKKANNKGLSEKQIDKMVDDAVDMIEEIRNGVKGKERIETGEPAEIKASKPISQIKKGDKIKIDGKDYEVDTHYVLIDHGNTKEMAIEIFDSEDHDCQLRYFDDQVESTIEMYELEEIMYLKRPVKRIEW